MRTFLVDRIRRLTIEDETFEAIGELGTDPFSKSMGAYSGAAVKITLRFSPSIASFIKERTWHSSQQFKDRTDGSVSMTLHVSDDYALRQWILGFGQFVRVVSPASLVGWVTRELDQARKQYASGEFASVMDSDVQPTLPFLFSNIATA